MHVYSFPGQFWVEKGVPFTLPRALFSSQYWVWPLLVPFSLSVTRCSAWEGVGGSPALRMGETGSWNYAGVGVAQVYEIHKMDLAPLSRKASWRR